MKKIIISSLLGAGLLLSMQAANAASTNWQGNAEMKIKHSSTCHYTSNAKLIKYEYWNTPKSLDLTVELRKISGGNACPASHTITLSAPFDANSTQYRFENAKGLGYLEGTLGSQSANLSGTIGILQDKETKGGYHYQLPIDAKLNLKMVKN